MKYQAPKKITCTNDKITEIFFSLTSKDFSLMLETGGFFNIVEFKISKKNKGNALKVKSPITIQLRANLTDNEVKICSTPPTSLDRLVFSTAISEILAGNTTTSISALYRLMNGISAGKNYRPTDNQAKIILNSIKKLSSLCIFADLTEICKYYNHESLKIDYQPVLPCRIYEGKLLGGKDTTLIEFTDEPPLLKIATLKNNQLITFDSKLLAEDSNFNHDRNGISTAARFYTLIRVMEIKLHRMTPTITVKDIFDKCRIADIRHARKTHCLDAIKFLLEKLKAEKIIQEFELQKDTSNKKLFSSIKIKY